MEELKCASMDFGEHFLLVQQGQKEYAGNLDFHGNVSYMCV